MIEKLDELRNVFALVTSDSLQCDLETTAVKKPGARGGGTVRMIGRKMITSTSVVGKKKITPRSSKEEKVI